MASTQRFQVLLSLSAQRDLTAIIRWSFREFGEAAALRYEALILQAIDDLADDPERSGSKAWPEIMVPNARLYSISFSRSRVGGIGVKNPRHHLLYKLDSSRRIIIARILHDSRNVAQHLPESYKRL